METTKLTLTSLDCALQHAARGWHVFPCLADKKPAIPSAHPEGDPLKGKCRGECGKLGHGFNDATTDPAKIREMWAKYPGALVGIACEKSGFFALDVDCKNDIDGDRVLFDLITTRGSGQPIASGPLQTTPSGGYHILFTLPAGVNVPNTSGKLAPGLDLRSRGYICTGSGYTWQPDHGPEEAITPAPGWLVDMIREMQQPSHKNGHSVTGQDAPAEYWYNRYAPLAREGNRNETLYHMGLQMSWSNVPESEALDYAGKFARDKALPEIEAIRTMQSAYNAPKREPARLPGAFYARGARPELSVNSAGQEEITTIRAGAGVELPQNGGGDLLLMAPADHDGHALCVLAMFPGKFLFCEAYGWLYYTGTHYQREGAEAQVDRAIVDTLKARRALGAAVEKYDLVKACHASAGNKNGVKDLLRSLITEEVGKFDNDPDRLNCNNGVLDLRTGELLPHDQGQRFTYCLPVDYDPKADRGAWVKFLLDALGNPEMVDYLQVATGYSLTGQTWEEILFYLYGPPRSGKGTFTETIIAMMGMPLATEADFATFTAERSGDTQNFDLAPLKPCRFVAAGESNKNQPLNPAKIKALTGRNFVRCAFKHRDHFTYQPAFKIWLSSNHPVNVDVDDDAAWGRVRVIDFPHSHLGEEDKSLKARLSTPAALRGVLAWAVEGAQLWYNLIGTSKGLPTPERIAEATQAQRDQQDHVKMFLGERCENDPEAFVASAELYQAYKSWCEDNGASAKLLTKFTAAISKKGYKTGVQRKINGKNLRVVTGLKLVW